MRTRTFLTAAIVFAGLFGTANAQSFDHFGERNNYGDRDFRNRGRFDNERQERYENYDRYDNGYNNGYDPYGRGRWREDAWRNERFGHERREHERWERREARRRMHEMREHRSWW